MRARRAAKRVLYRLLGDRTYATLQAYHWRRRLSHLRYPYDCLDDIARIVSPSDTVLDIGANVGQYSALLASLVGPGGRVIAFEPVPRTFNILTSVVSGLRLSNVEALRVALADVDGSARFIEMFDTDGLPDPGLSRLAARVGSGTLDVPVARLDSLCDGHLRVDRCTFVKIDVEGAELLVLRGASRFLVSRRPAILVEIDRGMSARYDCSPEETFAFLEERGYSPAVSASDNSESSSLPRQNVLFRPTPSLARS